MYMSDPPLTPCVKICVIDPLSALCIGCGRTVAEISLWREYDDDERRSIISDLPARLAATTSRAMRARRVGSRGR
jgi:predicted Fe-S protein YdhL (DUF1289 family)